MVKRRSLNDALSPEEEAFLKQEKQTKPQAPKPKPKKKETPPMARPALKEKFDQEPSSAPANASQHYSLTGNGAINARIDPAITSALLRASTDRRIAGLTPFTQRDIIAEALTEWMKKRGYLK